MRKILRRDNTGSLDLLLDTMCNAFGGIILIALLIVLLSSESTTDALNQASFLPDKDSIDRQLASARATLSELEKNLADLQTDPLAQKMNSLNQQIQEHRVTLEKSRQQELDAPKDHYVDYSGVINELGPQISMAQLQQKQLENELAALKNRRESIIQQTSSTETEMAAIIESRTENFRLPRERPKRLGQSNVILAYDQVYWMHAFGSRNTASMNFIRDGGKTKVIPIENQGWKLPRDAATITRAMQELNPKTEYIACYLFPDSVEVFREFRKMAHNLGLEVGWSLETDMDGLVFVIGGGYSPLPQ